MPLKFLSLGEAGVPDKVCPEWVIASRHMAKPGNLSCPEVINWRLVCPQDLGTVGQETVSTRPELLHVGIFAIFTKADVTVIRGGPGYHNCRRLVGKPSPVE